MAFKITKRAKISIIVLVLILVLRYMFGIFVIPPSGMIPEGACIVYYRPGIAASFISSADGVQADRGWSVSFLSRAMINTEFSRIVQDRKIISLPYSEWLYQVSTGGKKF